MHAFRCCLDRLSYKPTGVKFEPVILVFLLSIVNVTWSNQLPVTAIVFSALRLFAFVRSVQYFTIRSHSCSVETLSRGGFEDTTLEAKAKGSPSEDFAFELYRLCIRAVYSLTWAVLFSFRVLLVRRIYYSACSVAVSYFAISTRIKCCCINV